MSVLAAQIRAELRVVARNGEQLLVTLGIPVLLMVFFSTVDVLPTDTSAGDEPIDFLAPGILALAVMSTAMVSVGIATGFERSYKVLKRLGATPLGRGRLIGAKAVAVGVIEVAQVAVLLGVAAALGWRPDGAAWATAAGAVVLGTAAFAGVGLTLAGRLRAEVNLAAVNGLYVVLLLLGGMVFALEELPTGLRAVAYALPSGALADVLRDSLTGAGLHAGASWAVLAAWAIVTPVLAARTFRWE